MQTIFRSLKNIFINAPKGIKEVSDSDDTTHYKCLKCGADLIGHKGYGKLRILCKCGHSANVYTGKDIHFKSDTRKFVEHHALTKEERERIDEQSREQVFYKHINSDLTFYNTPQKLDRGIRCMLACHNREGGMARCVTYGEDMMLLLRPRSHWKL